MLLPDDEIRRGDTRFRAGGEHKEPVGARGVVDDDLVCMAVGKAGPDREQAAVTGKAVHCQGTESGCLPLPARRKVDRCVSVQGKGGKGGVVRHVPCGAAGEGKVDAAVCALQLRMAVKEGTGRVEADRYGRPAQGGIFGDDIATHPCYKTAFCVCIIDTEFPTCDMYGIIYLYSSTFDVCSRVVISMYFIYGNVIFY